MNAILSQMPIDLGDNLLLRLATLDDIDELADFNARLHEGEDNAVSTRDLMSGAHPTCKASDFTIVEDTQTGKIVSSMCLISQTWTYSGIPFRLGRPEIVATEKTYRRRGLVRKQFDVIHALSETRGELMQGITGIPWYYRLFGYEMALDIEAERTIDALHIPKLKIGQTETCRLRPRTDADNAFIQEVYETAIEKSLFACPRSPAMWEYEFNGRSEGNGDQMEWLIIEDMTGTRLGYAQYLPWHFDNFIVTQLERKPGIGYLSLMPSLLRELWKQAKQTPPANQTECEKPNGVQFMLGREHPAYPALPKDVTRKGEPYAWFIRIPDLIAFLWHIQPALEKHLIGTVAEGYTGELKLNLYRRGLHLKFHSGRITDIADWRADSVEDGDAAFPELTFLQLLCGRCRTDELIARFVDCWANDTASVLLDCLFPPFPGEVWRRGS